MLTYLNTTSDDVLLQGLGLHHVVHIAPHPEELDQSWKLSSKSLASRSMLSSDCAERDFTLYIKVMMMPSNTSSSTPKFCLIRNLWRL